MRRGRAIYSGNRFVIKGGVMSGRGSTRITAAVTSLAMMLCCLVLQPASAAPLEDSPVVLRSGDWAVHRTQDSMTDANICTASYRDDYAVQLGSHTLTIGVADGLTNVTLRFVEDKARAARPPKRAERAVSAIDIEGADFDQLPRSKRLRYRALTANDAIVEGNIDLNGAMDAYKNIQAGCVGDPLPER
jgi:hypothetical protein